MRKKGQVPDIFTPDGFNAALMIVQALKKGGDDVDKMISGLEGYKFLGPKGQNAVRPQDHALLQPMFEVKLTKTGEQARGDDDRHRDAVRDGTSQSRSSPGNGRTRGPVGIVSASSILSTRGLGLRHRRRHHRRRCLARGPRG